MTSHEHSHAHGEHHSHAHGHDESTDHDFAAANKSHHNEAGHSHGHANSGLNIWLGGERIFGTWDSGAGLTKASNDENALRRPSQRCTTSMRTRLRSLTLHAGRKSCSFMRGGRGAEFGATTAASSRRTWHRCASGSSASTLPRRWWTPSTSPCQIRGLIRKKWWPYKRTCSLTRTRN